MAIPQVGQTWTPRRDVEASGGARRVVPSKEGDSYVAWSPVDMSWIVEHWNHIAWTAWVARHDATTEGEGVPDLVLVPREITEEQADQALLYENAHMFSSKRAATAFYLNAVRMFATPPQPARENAEAKLAMAREALGRCVPILEAMDTLRHLDGDFPALDLARTTLAALNAEPQP